MPRGEGVLEVRGEQVQLRNRDLFLVPARAPFRLRMAPQSAAIEMAIRPPAA